MQFQDLQAGRRASLRSFYPSRKQFSVECEAVVWEARLCRPLVKCASAAQALRPFTRVSEQKQGRRFYVSGRVQGVGYRFFALDAAQRHGVTGYARNLLDGRVEVYAVGTAAQLEALFTDLQRGPRLARVEDVSHSEAELLPQFAVRFSIERES